MLRFMSKLPALILSILLLAPAAQAETIELTDRMVHLRGAINGSSVNKAVKRFLELDSEAHDPIWLMIDSFGGSVDAGFILIDLIKTIKSPTYCVITSKAYSMGAIIAVFCKKRYIYRHATMMFHEASYGALGEDPSIRSRIEFNVKYLDRIHEEIANTIGMAPDKYRDKIRDAWWVLAQEAVDAKFVDAVVTEVRYRKLSTETTEVKRTRTIKTKRVMRPDEKGPQALELQR